MAEQLPIIVRETWHSPATFEIASPESKTSPRTLRWFFGRKTIYTGRKVSIPGFGTAREFATRGVDKTVLQSRSWPNTNFTVRSVADIKKWFRRLRPQEADELARADARIADLHEQLSRARAVRQAVLREAWTRGHVVTWKELYEQAELNEAPKEGTA